MEINQNDHHDDVITWENFAIIGTVRNEVASLHSVSALWNLIISLLY